MEMKLKPKIEELKRALENFDDSMKIDLNLFPDIVKDSVESGQIQKFEFSCELLWKTIKAFLYEIEGLDINTPKGAIKEFFNSGYVSYEEYELLMQMIDDRNMLSHIYRQEMLKEIHRRIKNHLVLMNKVLEVIENKINELR
jgi:nucleotidyltransferase substrate binding protein (TIGR01987 family)